MNEVGCILLSYKSMLATDVICAFNIICGFKKSEYLKLELLLIKQTFSEHFIYYSTHPLFKVGKAHCSPYTLGVIKFKKGLESNGNIQNFINLITYNIHIYNILV
jgi:hypothetical protein